MEVASQTVSCFHREALIPAMLAPDDVELCGNWALPQECFSVAKTNISKHLSNLTSPLGP